MNEWDDDMLDEGPLDSDLEELGDDDEPETVPCPACRAEIYEDSPQCPVCGEYIFHRSGAGHRWPWWWMLATAAAIISFVAYILL